MPTKLKPFSSYKLESILTARGMSKQTLSTTMGRSNNYIADCCNKELISMSALAYLEAVHKITYDDIRPDRQKKEVYVEEDTDESSAENDNEVSEQLEEIQHQLDRNTQVILNEIATVRNCIKKQTEAIEKLIKTINVTCSKLQNLPDDVYDVCNLLQQGVGTLNDIKETIE